MTSGIIEIKISVQNEQSAQYYGEVLQSFANNVNELKIKEMHDLIKKKPNAFQMLASKLSTLKNWL